MTNDELWPEGVDFALAGKTYDELTEEEKASVHMNIYRDEDEALMAYNEHIIGIHQPIWVRVTKELNGVKVSHVVRATAGRIIFNRNIPQDLGFVKRFNEDGTPSDKFFDYEITETCGKKLLGRSLTVPSSSTASPSPPRCWTISRPPATSTLPAAPSPSPSRI